MLESQLRWDLTVAFIILGLGAWMTVNGVYQELPIIAQTAPEGYDIFSYVVVALALANIAPATYLFIRSRAIARASTLSPSHSRVSRELAASSLISPLYSSKKFPTIDNEYGEGGPARSGSGGPRGNSQTNSPGVDEAAFSNSSRRIDIGTDDSTVDDARSVPPTDNDASSLACRKAASEARWLIVDDVAAVVVVGGVGVASCVGLAWSWQSTAGTNTASVGLLSFTLLGGCVDCLTSVFFYPLAGRFPSVYMSVLLAGEAFTGLLASLLATAQATSTDPSAPLRFSVAVYFTCLAGIMACAAIALMYLQHLKPPSLSPLLGQLSSSSDQHYPSRDHGQSSRAGVDMANRAESFENAAKGEKSAGDGGALDDAAKRASSPLLVNDSDSGSDSRYVADSRYTVDKHDDGATSSDSKCNEAERSTDNGEAYSCDGQGRAWAALICCRYGCDRHYHTQSRSNRYRSWSLHLEQWLKEKWVVGNPAGRLFLAQATLAIIENGLHTTLAPAALGAVSGNSAELQGRLLSIALKLAAAGATLAAATAHALQPPPLFTKAQRTVAAGTANADANATFEASRTTHVDSSGLTARAVEDISHGKFDAPKLVMDSMGALVWGGLSFTVLSTSVYIVVAARIYAVMEEKARSEVNDNDSDDNSASDNDGDENNKGVVSGAIFVAVSAVVLCKVSVAFTKASLFVAFHPSSTTNTSTPADGTEEAMMPQFRESALGDRTFNSDTSPSSNSPANGATLTSTREHYQTLVVEPTIQASASADESLRWGGAGIQAGSLFGASLFFALTVVWRVL